MTYSRKAYGLVAFCCLLLVLGLLLLLPRDPREPDLPELDPPLAGALDTEWLTDTQGDGGEGMEEFAAGLTCAEEQETCNPDIRFVVYECPEIDTMADEPPTQHAQPVIIKDNYLISVDDALLDDLRAADIRGDIELSISGSAIQPGPEQEPSESPLPAWVSAQPSTPAGTALIDELFAAGLAFENVVYFANQGIFNFRPEGSPPVPLTDGDPGFVTSMTNVRSVMPTQRAMPTEATPVWILDTGSIPGQKAVLNDDLVEDVYRGHGPVIRDLVVDLLRDANIENPSVTLQRVLTENSVPGGDVVSPNRMSRAFDTTALLDTLAALPPTELVLNLSLSSQGCDDMYPPNHPLVQWFAAHPEVTTVASAGNDGSLVPNYPAAFSGPVSQPNPDFPDFADRIVSIGASTPDGHFTCFTNFHESVDAYFVGEQLVVDHPDMGWATWRGTSFSAPQAAAAVATGVTKSDLRAATPPMGFDCPP